MMMMMMTVLVGLVHLMAALLVWILAVPSVEVMSASVELMLSNWPMVAK